MSIFGILNKKGDRIKSLISTIDRMTLILIEKDKVISGLEHNVEVLGTESRCYENDYLDLKMEFNVLYSLYSSNTALNLELIDEIAIRDNKIKKLKSKIKNQNGRSK